MDTIIRTSAEEISNSVIDFIKATFKGKKIMVHIYEDTTADETDFLLKNTVTKKRLLESVENVKNMKKLKEYSIADIEHILNDDGK